MGKGKTDKRQARPVVTDLSAVKISGDYWVTRNFAEIADLISEGPIEGIVSGDYSYEASENKTGYDNVTFAHYSATGAAGGSALLELGFLRSVYWNDVPVVDNHGYFNFQDINVEHNFGDPIGELPSLSANLGDGKDFDLSVERAIGERLFGPQVKGYDKATNIDYSPGRQGEDLEKDLKLHGNSIKANSQHAVLEGAIDRYAKTYSVYNKECSDVQVNIKVDALFEQVMAGNKLYEKPSELEPCNKADVGYGDTKARTIEYNIYYKPLFDERFNPARKDADQEEGAFTDSWTLANGITERVEGKIDFPYIRTTSINVNSSFKDTPGFQGWKIRIVRLTPESLTSYLTNRSFVHSIVEVYGTRLRYPYTAMVYSRFDAENFQRIPSRSYDTRLLRVKVPSNYNPICKTYGNSDAAEDEQRTGAEYFPASTRWVAEPSITNGIFWDGEFKKDANGEFIREWTDNPAWCFYDLVTNPRYGLGEYIKETDVDKWSLYEIAQYCDGMVPDGFGSYEPRFSMNYIITSREEAFKVLNDLSSMFRGITYYAHGSIFAIQDKYKDPVFQFNNSNVAQGDFTYSSSSKKARHSVAIIRYNDKRDNFQPAVEYMEDEESVRKYGILELETTALGCTSKGQARRFGKWILASEAEETETVQFAIGHEGGLIRPGDVIQIYDNFRSPLKRSGRTNAVTPTTTTTYFGAGPDTVTGNSIILDSAMEFTPDKSYNFSLLTPTFSYNATQITGLNSSGVNEISRSQIQNLVFSGAHARVITGSHKSEYYEGGSGICTEIYFHTGEDFGGQSNQLDFDNYVITGYTNTGVVTELGATVADYSGGCFSGENLIWSVEPSDSEDAEFLSGNFSNFRIINIKETDDHNFSVSALAYSTGKYDSVDSSVKLQDLTYYDSPEFPTGSNNSTSAAELLTNTSLFLEEHNPYQEGATSQQKYKSIKISFDKAGYDRTETSNEAGTFNSSVEINDELTYLVSITTTGDPNQHHSVSQGSLYTIPTVDYKNIYKQNTNLIITPEDTLYTDVFEKGKIGAEILITEKADYYVTVFAANGAGRLSQGIQRRFNASDIDGLTFFSAVNNVTVSNLTTQGISDTSTPTSAKVQETISPGEPGFVWTVGYESPLLNAKYDNNEGIDGEDIPTYPLALLENDINWRVTFRAPSTKRESQTFSPNIPSNVIYLEFTGYRSDPSNPSFVLDSTYNNPALINNLQNRTLADDKEVTGYMKDGGGITTDQELVEYYLVDPSGMVVKNDPNAFPLREFDVVVEPHDAAGKTSQNHYVWANTIYNTKSADDTIREKGTEHFTLDSVNTKYDIFGATMPAPSGLVFAQSADATTPLNTILGGENDAFISPQEAYERNIPYVASAILLPDGSFQIGVEPSESLEGLQLYSTEELGEIFGGVQGFVFYYTVGTSSLPASDFRIVKENIPKYTQKENISETDSNGKAFGGIVSGAAAGTKVYRGYYLFGSDDSLGRISLKIPQIKGPNDNINFCGALFDTLSLAKAFTIDTRRPLNNVNGMALIFSDDDMNFNVRTSQSAATKYKINNKGQLDLSDMPPFAELNAPIALTEFSMVSQTVKCLSNQAWAQLFLSLDNFNILKDVLGYDGSTPKDNIFYRWHRPGGRAGNENLVNYPQQHKGPFYQGGCYTLPMMLANSSCRDFLDTEGNQNLVAGGKDQGIFKWEKADMSKELWFIMGYGNPNQYPQGTALQGNDSRSLNEGYLSNAYLSQGSINGSKQVGNFPKFNKDLSVGDRKVVEDAALPTMRALLNCITSCEQFDSASVEALASRAPLGNYFRYKRYVPGDVRRGGVSGFQTVVHMEDDEGLRAETQNLYDAKASPGYNFFYPFTTAFNSQWGSDPNTQYNKRPTVPIVRTVYEFPYDKNALMSQSISQQIPLNEVFFKLKVIEIKIPDLPFMTVQPDGERSPTGWRVLHYAYIEGTVHFTPTDPSKYIINPLKGYRGSTRKNVDDPQSDHDTIVYDSEDVFGTISTTWKGEDSFLWEEEAGGLVEMPETHGPRLIRKSANSFTFVLGAPKRWGGQGMSLIDLVGEKAMRDGNINSMGQAFNLINFSILKSNEN